MPNPQQRDAVQEIITNPELQAWDRLTNESTKAFQAFTIFRSSEKRTLTLVAQELKCSVQNVQRWATRYDWLERSRQWDIFNDRVAQQEEVKERIAMRRRFVQQGITMQKLGVIGLNEMVEIVNIGGKLHLSPGESVLLSKEGAALEQLGRGDVAQTGNVVFEITIGDVDEQAMKGH